MDLNAQQSRDSSRPAPPYVAETSANGGFQGQDLSGHDFSGANLVGADFTGARLVGATFKNAELQEAVFTNCELSTADFSGANLERVSAERAGFGKANLHGACLLDANFCGCSFTGADLSAVDLRGARLAGARMRATDLSGSECARADFTGVDLTGARLGGASFHQVNFRDAKLQDVTEYQTASFLGSDIRDVNFAGAYLLRRHIMDQDYVHEFRGQSPLHQVIWALWWFTSDCGRSFSRWGLLTAVITGLYGAAYTLVDIDYGDYETWLSPYYFSLVTLTTLGYGDVLPASLAAQVMTMTEVAIGYLLLGGLISIMATKMARRAE